MNFIKINKGASIDITKIIYFYCEGSKVVLHIVGMKEPIEEVYESSKQANILYDLLNEKLRCSNLTAIKK